MEYIAIILAGASLLVSLIILIVLLAKKNKISDKDFKGIREAVTESINATGKSASELIAMKNKVELDKIVSQLNTTEKKLLELEASFEGFNKTSNEFYVSSITCNNQSYEKINNLLVKFITAFSESNSKQKLDLMNQMTKEIAEFNKNVNETLTKFDSSIKERLEDFKKDTKESLAVLNKTVSDNLKEIREDNNNKIDLINKSVNEKLEKTLEDKLKNSFENVIKQISNVNTAIGEIKGIASDVGSLKNVLTNVKTKGIVGEVILGNIIREFLTHDQYEENIATKKNSGDRVEFAVKLPGINDDTMYLPIDSKFPYTSYSTILESDSLDEIKEAKKRLRADLIKYAKDVSDKYLDVPNTTDFAIIFLPLEGLYLEVLNMGLFEEIQKKYHINITGPTTLSAFINSLQMGFRSVMIQKRSSDVFKLLAAVKTEFNKFADVLTKTQRKFTEASDELDKLVGTRTRMINSKLKSIDTLGEDESINLLESDN